MRCVILGCDRKRYCGDLCSKHYERKRKTGTTDDGPRARLPFVQRLWRYIERRGPDECWIWTGAIQSQGYGGICIGGARGKIVRAHRAVWEQFNGPIPKRRGYHGTCVLHKCDTPACCNPSHLFLGTQAENMRDMVAKGRQKLPDNRGSAHPAARLTEAKVRSIRASKKTSPHLAVQYGVAAVTIRAIRSGRLWRHLL